MVLIFWFISIYFNYYFYSINFKNIYYVVGKSIYEVTEEELKRKQISICDSIHSNKTDLIESNNTGTNELRKD
jgi:G3E family GTPase